jgi:hypothetical protein
MDDDDDGPPWRFGGIAVAAGDILHADDGTRVLFTDEELQKAAETQAGEPLTKDHPEDDRGRPKYPPDVDETFGKVQKAGWVASAEGVGYEVTTHDELIADGVRAGTYEVSVHPFFDTEPYDGPEADVKAVDIVFGDLSVVSKGDSPSNTARWGPNQALASLTASAGFVDELSAAADAPDDVDDPEGLVEKLARKFGIIDDRGDRRGSVWVSDQTSDGSAIRVNEAQFDDARWMLGAHLEGDEFAEIGPGLGPAIGESDAYDGGQVAMDATIPLDEPLEADTTVYAVLHYASDDGELLDPITAADGGYFYESAFVGVAPEDAEVTASDEAAESAADHDTGSHFQHMDDDKREQYATFLTANAGFTEESVDGMDDDVLKRTYELAAQATDDGGDGGSTSDADDDPDDVTLGDMTPAEAASELGDELREQGFVTEDNADSLLQEAQAQASKAEKVDEIIAKSDDFDDGDRDDLLASADSVIDREHKRIRREQAAGLPGTAGAAGTITASAGSDEDPDAYGTGVEGEE